MNTFDLCILEADSTFFEGKAVSLVVPTTEGSYGILAHHENMVSALVTGIVKFTDEQGNRLHGAISGGLIRVEDNKVLILSETAERPEEIDVNRINADIAAAKEDMDAKKSIEEYTVAQARMARAINRLKVKQKYKH